jgi:hypothetical protein
MSGQVGTGTVGTATRNCDIIGTVALNITSTADPDPGSGGRI